MSKQFKSSFNIPGTLPNSQNYQLLVSSGIPSLDKLVGDGLAIGTLTVIEEDIAGTYAKIILKYFLAEGVVSKHSIVCATQEEDPHKIITRLPALVKNNVVDAKTSTPDQMKIAFRYANLPTDDPEVKHQFGHYFDLSKTMSNDYLENVKIHCWKKEDNIKSQSSYFNNSAYDDLLATIKSELEKGKFFLTDTPEKRSILRIGIYGLGSPLWMSENLKDTKRDLNKFFFCLRALLKSAFAVAIITLPSFLYDKTTINRCINASDVSIRLKSLGGTALAHNKYLSDYDGYFYIEKLAAMNTFVSKHPGPIEYMFKLRKNKFSIEMLHLPPELEETSEGKKAPISLGCASNTKHLLEF